MATTVSKQRVTPLQHGYCFWYMRRGKNVNNNTSTNTESSPNPLAQSSGNLVDNVSDPSSSSETKTEISNSAPNPYENSIKIVATVKTVEDFWSTYDYLVRPNDLPTTTDYHFFRDGIKPTWEDPGNARGGKWIVRLRKGLASRYWEETLLALIGGQFTGVPDGEICGAVVSIRYGEDIVSVWNKRSDDRETTERLRDAIKKILQLPHSVHMEYKPHQASLQDKSSFRNTTVWKPKSERGRVMSERDEGGPRRSSSWGERDKPKRDIERSWR